MSACGSLVAADAVIEAAQRAGAMTLCDLTQAVGWMPVDAARFDITVGSAYKWLCAPRGSAFVTISPDVAGRIRPTSAGWYAGQDIWASVYGPEMHLASDARRFDVSPAWLSWAGTVPALRLFAELDMAEVRDYDAGLADQLCTELGQEPTGSAILSRALTSLLAAGTSALAGSVSSSAPRRDSAFSAAASPFHGASSRR